MLRDIYSSSDTSRVGTLQVRELKSELNQESKTVLRKGILMDKNIEYRSSSWVAEDEKEVITGYAVVFENKTVLYRDPDTNYEYCEIIDRHALDNADLSDVVLRYDHEGHVLARTRNNTLKLSVDDKGLKIEADMTKSEEARNHYEEVKNGLVDKMSFAFTVAPGGDEYDTKSRTRRIKSIDRLFDVSLVTFPAYEQTEVNARSAYMAYADADKEALDVYELRNKAELICEDMDIDPDSEAPDITNYDLNDSRDVLSYRQQIIKHATFRLRECRSLKEAQQLMGTIERTKAAMLKDEEERKAVRSKVANGAGEIRERIGDERSLHSYQTTNNRGTNMDIKKEEFYQDFVEKRAAAGTSGMSAVIPDVITDNYVIEKAPGAFLDLAQITHLAHAGTINIPVAALQTVVSHTENTATTDNGYVPGVLTITHAEYVYKTAYSDLGMVESAANFQQIIENVCMDSALKKMDDLCLGAVAGFTFVDGTNAVEVANGSNPTYAEFMELAGYLGNDFIGKAKWFMAPSTYFNWLLGLKDSANRPILDASKKVEEQAFAGFGIELDAQIPDSVIYFGDATRIHMNFGRPIEINAWDDLDYNQRKVAVRTVVGAAAESGCMVKMYEAAA